MLERQFPIESTDKPLKLKSAQDYAKDLSVHPNYLNRAVKELTGKPTTTHITERIVSEAKALLQHTNWNIADIAYALGFEYPTYINNFFKSKPARTSRHYECNRFEILNYLFNIITSRADIVNGEAISSIDPESFKRRHASFATKKLLLQLNNSSDPAEMRYLLRQITASEIDDSVAIFTPMYINYGKHTKIGKNVFITLIVYSLI